MLSLFRPAPHIDRLPADKVDPFYKRMRWQVFFGIFFGYAGYQGAPQREELAEVVVDWLFAERPGKVKTLKQHPRKNKVGWVPAEGEMTP